TRDDGNARPPGVMVHAQALRSALNGGFIGRVPAWIVFALCLIAAGAWFFARRTTIAVAAVIAGGAALAALSTALLANGRDLPPGPVFATLFIAASARATRETAAAMRERRKMREAFSGYVSPAVMDDLMAGEIDPQVGG